ncbi:MAG: twitching motility protein PilT [Firmicutes bacterium ML8_F2]|nr:MAG: twitching motility protein PilT [Firmicutes bacterium ML8_F2]
MSSTVYVRFYAELNDFLPPEKRQVTFACSFFGRPTVKDLIESLGAPHTEIDLILVNGRSTGFSHHIALGDRLSVYPVFESLDITSILKVRPDPLREPRFILDIHLGKLAVYLRMFGFDTLYRNDYEDSELASISKKERRILLTRDRGLLKRSAVTHGYLVRENKPSKQIAEILRRFDLVSIVRPFRLCLRCNRKLEPISKESVRNKVPPRVFSNNEEFCRCPECRRIYWRGSHYEKMDAFIHSLIS